jgi:hypothetical protein
MSKMELARFINEFLPQHSELTQGLQMHANRQELAKELARVRAEAGFDFSEAEAVETLTEMSGGELSENELGAVAGGWPGPVKTVQTVTTTSSGGGWDLKATKKAW